MGWLIIAITGICTITDIYTCTPICDKLLSFIRGDLLVKVMLKPLSVYVWSVRNSSRATWPLVVKGGGRASPEKVPKIGDSAWKSTENDFLMRPNSSSL